MIVAAGPAGAAFEAEHVGVLVDESFEPGDLDAAALELHRRAAISYAGYRVLHHRYSQSVGAVGRRFGSYVGLRALEWAEQRFVN